MTIPDDLKYLLLPVLLLSSCTIEITEKAEYPYSAQRCYNCIIESDICPEILLESSAYQGCTGSLFDEYTKEDHEFLCERTDSDRIWEFSCDFTGN